MKSTDVSGAAMAQSDQLGHFRADGIEPQDADLVLSTLRHQRDLFSGPLGIPDVTTRVGSVIHAFETMARQRQSLGGGVRDSYRADKPYDAMANGAGGGGGAGGTGRYRSHRSNVKRVGDANRHKIILPSPKISPSSSVEAGGPGSGQHFYHAQHTLPHQDSQFYANSQQPPNATSSQQPQYHQQHFQHQQHHHHHHPHIPPASFSYTDPHGARRHPSGGGGHGGFGEGHIHINNNNFEPNLPHSTDEHNNHCQTLPRAGFPTANVLGADSIAGAPSSTQHYPLNNENESSNFDSLNLDDDYRKSSFGKQSKLLQHQQQQQQQQSQHFLQQRSPPSNIDTFLLGRNHQQESAPGGRGTARGIWSLFGAASQPSTEPGGGFSTSRNNPNVFFNASSTPTTMTLTTTTTTTTMATTASIAPQQASTSGASTLAPFAAVGATAGSGTMRYYNHDNGANSGNRRTVAPSLGEAGRGTLDGGNARDDRAQRNDGDGSFANEGDNEAADNHVSGDKFLRGTTVSQSFIKNVRIIGKKSSSYDVNGAGGASNTGSHRKEGRKRDETGGAGGTSSSSNGFKQRGSLMMAAAAKHFTKRSRAPQPAASTGTVADGETLPGTLRPNPSEDATDTVTLGTGTGETSAKGSNGPSTATRASGGTAKRRLFQPRTMDRAEI
uniref:Uncharacterized protein n=1 Tax=Anopheles atroparvus TaxID=41427 RepID=A0AAG5CV79_ANOAO